MDKLTFIAEVVKTLTWPTSLVLLAVMLRKPVGELIPLLRKLKYKEVEMEFSREIANLKANSTSIPEQPIRPTDSHSKEQQAVEHLTERVKTKRDDLLRMMGFSTRVSVMEAWLEVEAAATEVASSFWNIPPNNSLKNFPRLGEYLLQCKVIDQKQLESFKRLQQLRNKAAHAQELDLSEEDARSYVELALALAAHIRTHQ
ncbi:hypothetical protein LQR31_09235 [Chromobacterium vaccinii]|uniref:hypothetical protein n=1 Tax=Chromobacterium vaccinii TaxID=1108595 RepID=UPI001E50F19B|nr:hypothetical protein [Chromobacterium vaccinii]MCD4484652.1 hypothetical protein [Chromobacterium vaccinii]